MKTLHTKVVCDWCGATGDVELKDELTKQLWSSVLPAGWGHLRLTQFGTDDATVTNTETETDLCPSCADGLTAEKRYPMLLVGEGHARPR